MNNLFSYKELTLHSPVKTVRLIRFPGIQKRTGDAVHSVTGVGTCFSSCDTKSAASLLLFCLVLLFSTPGHAASHKKITLFQGTQYPLTVHFIQGDRPGPAVMVQGGIQGDETAGYLTAQILTNARVSKGSLIIIPRANIPTVHARKRQINVDLNRRFDKDYNSCYEDFLARAIRFLIKGSDAFIHLHEGSGFYYPVYVNNLRNPRRFGQSIIIDTTVFQNRIDLVQLASTVLLELNNGIPEKYQFQLFNTNTFAVDTVHPEQRKSLTYHALSTAGIPAVAIEVSKDIRQLGWKVLQQLRATALVLKEYGVELTIPALSEQVIENLIRRDIPLAVNGQAITSTKNTTLTLPVKEIIAVSVGQESAVSPLEPVPAVFASDRPGVNLLNSPRLALTPVNALEVLADGQRLSRITMRWSGITPPASLKKAAAGRPLFVCWINNALTFVPAGSVLYAVEGDQFIVDGIWKERARPAGEIINIKGYISQAGKNTGQDMGEEVILDPDLFIQRYLKQKETGVSFQVVRETSGQKKAAFSVHIAPRQIKALHIKDSAGKDYFLPWTPERAASVPSGEYTLEAAWSNGPETKLTLTHETTLLPWGTSLTLAPDTAYPLTLRQATTFKPLSTLLLQSEK